MAELFFCRLAVPVMICSGIFRNVVRHFDGLSMVRKCEGIRVILRHLSVVGIELVGGCFFVGGV